MGVEENKDENAVKSGKEFVTSNVRGLFNTSLFVDSNEYHYKIIKIRERGDQGEEGENN